MESPFVYVMDVFLWEEWIYEVRERKLKGHLKQWITNLVWYCIYESNGLNFWVHIHGVTIAKSGLRYNERMLT